MSAVSAAPVAPPVAPYRPFDVTVHAVRQLSPHFTRVTFAGDDLHLFGDTCLDQRVKVVLPLPGPADPFAHLPRHADWYARWRELPEHRRNPFRTYTVRAVRAVRSPAGGRHPQPAREVDIDFVRHGDGGPASRWVEAARPGDPVVLIGPDARAESATVGVEWKPGPARTVLLAGDETAVPAITSILESLPADTAGQAFLEVPTDADRLGMPPASGGPLRVPAGVEVHWLPRGDRPHGERLRYAVRSLLAVRPAGGPLPDPSACEDIDVETELGAPPACGGLWETPELAVEADAFAWLAGEAKTIADLRRHLVRERGWPRRQVAFMGYWREGRAEA
ncbi:MAG TPA: siderophore-interacting protein [Segeticoccus sp.]|nr:siderophore-interacting protein [Segeticoccus sp.]